MEEENMVSVWIGNFDSEEQFFKYIYFYYNENGNPSSSFTDDFGINYYNEDFQEAVFSNDLSKEIEGLSYAESFVTHLENTNLSKYNSLLCLYDFDYKHSISKSALVFVGSYPYLKN